MGTKTLWVKSVEKQEVLLQDINSKGKISKFIIGKPTDITLNQVIKVNIISIGTKCHVLPGMTPWEHDFSCILTKFHNLILIMRKHSNPNLKILQISGMYSSKMLTSLSKKYVIPASDERRKGYDNRMQCINKVFICIPWNNWDRW